jgi:hypothetical protein
MKREEFVLLTHLKSMWRAWCIEVAQAGLLKAVEDGAGGWF